MIKAGEELLRLQAENIRLKEGIKQAREEIESNKNTTSMLDCAEFYNNGLDTALAILDKLIESEEVND
jgi:hypothetical protein